MFGRLTYGTRGIRGRHRVTRLLARIVPVTLATLLVCAAAYSKADDRMVTEYRIKAAFLYNFARFVDWPADIPATGKFTMCVLGADPFGKVIDSLAGKIVHGDKLEILRLQDSTVAGECRMVFISGSEAGNIDDILATLASRPVLTVSDTRAFAERGGIIRLKLVDMKVRFDINIDAAERAGLSISSKLLSLATIVRGTERSNAQ